MLEMVEMVLHHNPLSDDQKFLILWVMSVTSTVSMIGAAWMACCIIRYGRLSMLSNRLLLYLALNDIMFNVSDLLMLVTNYTTNEGICIAHGVFYSFAQMTIPLLTFVIAFNLFSVVVMKRENMARREKYYLLFVYGLSAFLALLPLTTQGYGKANSQYRCWIRISQNQTDKEISIAHMWRSISVFIIPLLCMFGIIFCYTCIYLRVKKLTRLANASNREETSLQTHIRKEQRKRQGSLLKRLFWYPVIFVCLWITPIIRRLYNFNNGHEVIALIVLQYGTYTLTGLLNAIVWGILNPELVICVKKIPASEPSYDSSTISNFSKESMDTNNSITQTDKPNYQSLDVA
mmetsp:Transcript_2920/g.3263  ORF Transcript_2920/g.3263 Transcript_2920/m.3263 type:complete len:347 (+) Transcript_2920:29-1069(+)